MMNSEDKGMVLITVLIFLTLLSLLIVLSLESSALEQRMSLNKYSRLKNHEIAEAGLVAGYKALQVGMPICVIDHAVYVVLNEKARSWWLSSKTCHGEFNHHAYQYVVFSLGKNKQKQSFWRIVSRVEHGRYHSAQLVRRTVVLHKS